MLDCGFSTSEVTRRTGVTARQLQWWDERRLVSPARIGRRRLYSLVDLIDIAIIEEFRRRGISLQQVNRVVRFLRTQLHVRLAELMQDGREHFLLLDDDRVYLRTGADQMIDLMRDARQPMFLVCLSDAARRLQIDAGLLAGTPCEARQPLNARSYWSSPRSKEEKLAS
jgi:DNA-binding transcriptional MerR regulator